MREREWEKDRDREMKEISKRLKERERYTVRGERIEGIFFCVQQTFKHLKYND